MQWERRQKHKTNNEHSSLFLTDRSREREILWDSDEHLSEREEIRDQYGKYWWKVRVSISSLNMMSKDKWSWSMDSKRKWCCAACKSSVKTEKLQKAVKEDTESKQHREGDKIFFFQNSFWQTPPAVLCVLSTLTMDSQEHEETVAASHLPSSSTYLRPIPRMYSMLQGLWKNA